MSDSLGERKNRLEEEFFARYNQDLLRKIRDKGAEEEKRRSLAQASGIQDEAVLDKLVDLDLCSETLVALSLVPLVSVAWADGVMEPKERDAVLQGARETGLEESDLSYQLLQSWLDHKPEPDLLATWKEYLGALCRELGEGEKASLKREILGRARAVAEAAGGFLGLVSTVSDSEEGVLRDLEAAFS